MSGCGKGGNGLGKGGGASQEYQVRSFSLRFDIVGSMTSDQDGVSHLELMWHSGGSQFVCLFELFPGVLSDQFEGL